MKKIIFLSLCMVLMVACSETELESYGDSLSDKATTTSDDYSIPLNVALADLDATIALIDNNTSDGVYVRNTRKKREYSNVKVIYCDQSGKAMDLSSNPLRAASSDKLLYVVEFADNEGSAVLAADSRIDESVLAITDEGSILDECMPVYEESTGYEGNKFEDFSLYNEIENDYYVGATDVLALEYCVRYAEDCIDNGASAGSSTAGSAVTKTETGNWTNGNRISPLLTTLWHQGAPFNNSTPNSRWTIFHDYVRGPAGCVAIALAQIIAYHEYPANFSVNGYLIDWDAVKNISSVSNRLEVGNTYDQTAVSQLVRNIGEWCDMVYMPSFGFALPRKARDCMSVYGYNNVVRHYGYDIAQINTMLQNNNPVFIASISGLVGGHAWVIDGSIIQNREVKGYNAYGALVKTTTESRELLHCSFGWRGGFCNGYYVSKVFDLNNGATELESYEKKQTTESDYSWAFHLITYDNPN